MRSEIPVSEDCGDVDSSDALNLHRLSPESPAYTEIFFPLGFPLQIKTNSEEILDAAHQSWGSFSALYHHKPLCITLIANKNQRSSPLPVPISHIEGHLLTVQAGAANFIVGELDKGSAFGLVSRSSLDAPRYLRYYFLESVALSMISTLRAVALHAACVEWKERGILLCGESGAGKSSLAFACARSGWGYVSDDASYLLLEGYGRTVTGNSHQIRFRDSAVRLFPELVGCSITDRAAGKPSIEVPTSELQGIKRTDSTEIAYILFLNRDGERSPGLRPLSPEKAREYFNRFLLLSSREESATTNALERLLQVPRFELSYTEIDCGVTQMQRLIEETL